ncbi:N-acetylmuramoyl-L-alanine amidase [Streptomyces sp. WAC07061]|uniref:peptidoglycan recognition protein family protein n=1 Tax=Streptomyces sp. WAC07061 TaxID=2487410 RepID=UPI000F7AF08A|nr:peptidoglycan recognition family protein [Streptomyces sp. WAC07061]RSS54682.1 N-acetylmuramoyl-L-alanine amidase [Streptomyces sp. WAC07061]
MTSLPSRFSRRGVFSTALALGAATLLPTAATGRARAATGSRRPEGRDGATTPRITDCDGWGAREASEEVVVLDTRPERIIVHHTASANVSDYSQERAHALARAIQRFHMDTQGWIDTGQHFTVSRGAFVLEGRHHSLAALESGDRLVRGAHCVGQNSVAIGIENEGTYTTQEPPAAQFSTLADLCAQVCRQYDLSPSEIYGHRDFNSTACPGDRLYAMLPRLRQDVALRLGNTQPVEQPRWPVNLPPAWSTDPEAAARSLTEYLPPNLLTSLRTP